jgi:hypothetical protein
MMRCSANRAVRSAASVSVVIESRDLTSARVKQTAEGRNRAHARLGQRTVVVPAKLALTCIKRRHGGRTIVGRSDGELLKMRDGGYVANVTLRRFAAVQNFSRFRGRSGREQAGETGSIGRE